MGFCDEREYQQFLRQAPQFELRHRHLDPVRQWKLSPIDLASLDRWDVYTAAKEAMFRASDTEFAPWTVVRSNDKKRGRLEAMRHVLTHAR